MPIKVERKVREIAGSLYVCFPKYWTDSVGLTKDQTVIIELTDDHSCKIELRG
jgi:transglutaminase/protease-like cytokinesis protein 3